jgi:hypothetical protein
MKASIILLTAKEENDNKAVSVEQEPKGSLDGMRVPL